jgi:hypothetical protein
MVTIGQPAVSGTAPTGFSASGLPSGLAISSTGAITGQIPAGTIGVFTATIYAIGGVGNPLVVLTFNISTPGNASVGGQSQTDLIVPTIHSFSRRVLSATGGSVTVFGRNLGGLTSLQLGVTSVSISHNTDTSFTFAIPAMPIGTWALSLNNELGSLHFLNAIRIEEAEIRQSKSSVVGYLWTEKYSANSVTPQSSTLSILRSKVSKLNAKFLVCWGHAIGYTPTSTQARLASQRAEVLCQKLAANSDLKTYVRLRFGASAASAMKVSAQLWR